MSQDSGRSSAALSGPLPPAARRLDIFLGQAAQVPFAFSAAGSRFGASGRDRGRSLAAALCSAAAFCRRLPPVQIKERMGPDFADMDRHFQETAFPGLFIAGEQAANDGGEVFFQAAAIRSAEAPWPVAASGPMSNKAKITITDLFISVEL